METHGSQKHCCLPVIEIKPETEGTEEIKSKLETREETKRCIEIIPENQNIFSIRPIPKYQSHSVKNKNETLSEMYSTTEIISEHERVEYMENGVTVHNNEPEELKTLKQTLQTKKRETKTEQAADSGEDISEDVKIRNLVQMVDDVVQDCESLLSSQTQKSEKQCSKVR